MSDQKATDKKPRTRRRPKGKQQESQPSETAVETSKSEVAEAADEIKKAFGDKVIYLAKDRPSWKHIPTGIFALDMALLGGIPQSQMTLIYGRESSGKSTLAYRTMACAQRKFPDKYAVLIDVEGTYEPVWGARHGIDNERLYLVQPVTGEQALDVAESMIRSLDVSIVTVDSLAALLPYKEMEGSVEDQQPGMQARMIGKFVRKATAAMLSGRQRNHLPTLLFINQWRMKIGVFRGDPRVLPGGMAQHFAACAKIEMLNKEHLGKDALDNETVDHNAHSFKIAKNKAGVAMRNGEFRMVRNPAHPLGQGFIDDARTVVVYGRKFDLITGSGGSFKVDGVEDRKFRTLDEIVQFMYSDMGWFFAFQNRIICMYREANGLRPDGWL